MKHYKARQDEILPYKFYCIYIVYKLILDPDQVMQDQILHFNSFNPQIKTLDLMFYYTVQYIHSIQTSILSNTCIQANLDIIQQSFNTLN